MNIDFLFFILGLLSPIVIIILVYSIIQRGGN